MKRLFMLLLKFVAALFLGYLIYFNVALFQHEKSAKNSAATLQSLRLLQKSIRENWAAEEMQQIYPEGFVFLHAMSALAWTQVFEQSDAVTETKSEALKAINFSIKALESSTATEVFNPNLPLKWGAFYKGWLNFVRAKRLEIAPDSALETRFKLDCAAIAAVWTRVEKTYLESYEGMVWPADNLVCLAALNLHDRLYPTRFQAVRKKWLEKIGQQLDPATGLISHSFSAVKNAPVAGARGSSQSLMLCFLPEIDSAFALSQFQIFKKHFLDSRFGLPIIREYPLGSSGDGDVDSGPVFWGIGGVASIVGIGAFGRFHEFEIAIPLRHSIEAFLFKNDGQVIFGELPMADAFLIWASGGLPKTAADDLSNWAWRFQLWSLAMGLPLAFWLFLPFKKK